MSTETLGTPTIEAKTVNTGRFDIHYQEAGQGPVVILLHGSGPGASGLSNFRPNIVPLAGQFRVLAVDMPGWGGSSPATSAEYDHARDLAEFMDALGIDKAAVVGNSMGGMTAISFAARYPERITHLITMGPGSGPSTLFQPAGPSEGIKVLFRGYRDPSPETMADLVEVMAFSNADTSGSLAKERSEGAKSNPAHLANFLDGLAQGRGPVPSFPNVQEIAAITTPALLLHGRDDRVVHFEHSLKLVALIPDSRLVLLNQCGHWAQLEHADEFNRLVTSFINN